MKTASHQPTHAGPSARRLNAVQCDLHLSRNEAFADPLLASFTHFSRYSTASTELAAVTVYDGDRVVGVAPSVRLNRQPLRRLLEPSVARWVAAALGPLGLKNSILVDTAFLAYDSESPFRVHDPLERPVVGECVLNLLRRQPGIDNIMVAEPQSTAVFADHPQFDSFPMMPMVHVTTSKYSSLGDYLGGLTKKRRRNYRVAVRALKGQRIEIAHARKLKPQWADGVYGCLRKSAHQSDYFAPYQDVLSGRSAFLNQSQEYLVAEDRGEVVGFVTFIDTGDRLMQTHGGFDYDRSTTSCAYHNLMYHMIETAIQRQRAAVSFGPLNNETKRRIGEHFVPMVASVWNRTALDRCFARNLFLRRFQIRDSGTRTD